MKEIKEIALDIRCMLAEGEKYGKEAVKHKTQFPELAKVYVQISDNRVKEINALHDQVLMMIEKVKKEGKEIPSSMMAVWDWEHENMIEEMSGIKRWQEMYKG